MSFSLVVLFVIPAIATGKTREGKIVASIRPVAERTS